MSLLRSLFNLLKFNRKNWRAVVLCIVAATVFWFFNALNKSYTTNISFPLSFDYDQQYYIPVRPLPTKIRLNITGNGWDLFRRSAGLKVPPLTIPLDRPSEVTKIVGSTLPALFASQLETMQINFVVTDTIYLDIEPKAGRWLTVKMDSVDHYLKRGYGVMNMSIMPDSIFIEGPIKLVTNLPKPCILTLDVNNLDEDFDDEVEVKLPESHLIRRNPPTVRVRIRVDKFIEVADTIKLEVINVPKNWTANVEARKIFVVLRLLESQRNLIRRDSVRAILDLKNIRHGQRQKIAPEVKGIPSSAGVMRIDSVQVRY